MYLPNERTTGVCNSKLIFCASHRSFNIPFSYVFYASGFIWLGILYKMLFLFQKQQQATKNFTAFHVFICSIIRKKHHYYIIQFHVPRKLDIFSLYFLARQGFVYVYVVCSCTWLTRSVSFRFPCISDRRFCEWECDCMLCVFLCVFHRKKIYYYFFMIHTSSFFVPKMVFLIFFCFLRDIP